MTLYQICAVVCLIFHSVASASSQSSSRPNIVIILADDLGWDDVSFHGSKQIPTPNLDALAYDGLILSNYYVQPICSPTRGALLTGRHPVQLGLQVDTINGAAPYGLALNETILPQYLKTLGYNTHMVGKHELINADAPWGLGLNETLLPQYLATLGFKTHMVGKWHLGFFAEEYTPTKRGFDTHYGFWTGKEDYWDHTDQEGNSNMTWGFDFRRNMDLVEDVFGQYSTHLFTHEAEQIINNHNKSKPLFLYFAHQGVHTANSWKPLEAPWSYYEQMSHIEDKRRRMFAAMVAVLDESVGNVTRALHNNGLLNDTIIIFSTDNGGPANGFDENYASNMPLRGMKHTVWEGGIRGTGFVWSPRLEKSGIVASQLIQVEDWLPTLLRAAGYNMSTLPINLYGIDQWDGLQTGKTRKSTIRTEMLHNIDTAAGEFALRVNDWKLIFSTNGQSAVHNSWYPAPQKHTTSPTPYSDFSSTNEAYVEIDKANNKAWLVEPNSRTEDESLEFVHSASSNNVLRFGQSELRKNNDDKEAPAHMFKSELDIILRSIGRTGPKGSAYVVECGVKPVNASTNCDVTMSPCLFNIKRDPCEYYNEASSRSYDVMELLERMRMFNLTAVPPRNKPQDPKAYPGNNDGVWKPWVKLTNNV